MNLPDLFLHYHLEARGVIHIGGTGEEIELYEAMGFERILFIQPDRALFDKIHANIGTRMHAIGICITLSGLNCEATEANRQQRRLDSLLDELKCPHEQMNVIVYPKREFRSLLEGGQITLSHMDLILATPEYVPEEMRDILRGPMLTGPVELIGMADLINLGGPNELLAHVTGVPSSEARCSAILRELLPAVDPKREGAFVEVGLGSFGWDFIDISRLGFECRVVEPDPKDALWVACHNCGIVLTVGVISNATGRAAFYPGRNNDVGSLDPSWWGVLPGVEPRNVPAHTLGYFFAMIPRPITGLKLDVEAWEWEILKQLPELPTERLPKVIMFEYSVTPGPDGKPADRSPLNRAVWSLFALKACGYDRCIIVECQHQNEEFRLSRPAKEITADLFHPDTLYGNIIAIRGDAEAPAAAPSFADE